MTDEDVVAIRALLTGVPRPRSRPRSVLCPSGEDAECLLVRELYGIDPERVPRSRWDLDMPAPPGLSGDLGMACNTFMCSRDPGLWLRHLAGVVPLLVVQDLSVARRAGSRWTDPGSGDVARYSVSSHGVYGVTDPDGPPVFDLADPVATGGARVLACVPYMPTVAPDGTPGWVRFAALLDLSALG